MISTWMGDSIWCYIYWLRKSFFFPFHYTVPGRCQSIALTNLAPPLYTGQHKGDTLVCLYFVCVTTVILYFKPTTKFRDAQDALGCTLLSCFIMCAGKTEFWQQIGLMLWGKYSTFDVFWLAMFDVFLMLCELNFSLSLAITGLRNSCS